MTSSSERNPIPLLGSSLSSKFLTSQPAHQESQPTQPNMPASEYPPYTNTSYNYPLPNDENNRHVHFPDSFSPSSFSMKIKLGPRDHPTSVITISIRFEPGRFPRIKFRTKKPRDGHHRRRRRRF